MKPRTVEIIYGLSMITLMAGAIIAVAPLSLPFYLAGICFGWGFHAGVAKHRNVKSEGR